MINFETTPKRETIGISINTDDVKGENPRTMTDWKNIVKDRKRNGGVEAYKEELCAIIKNDRALSMI